MSGEGESQVWGVGLSGGDGPVAEYEPPDGGVVIEEPGERLRRVGF